jgi:hypothetical protein
MVSPVRVGFPPSSVGLAYQRRPFAGRPYLCMHAAEGLSEGAFGEVLKNSQRESNGCTRMKTRLLRGSPVTQGSALAW